VDIGFDYRFALAQGASSFACEMGGGWPKWSQGTSFLLTSKPEEKGADNMKYFPLQSRFQDF
jgi:hypothetical protein